MPSVRLTDAAIKRFPLPESGTKTYWDKASPVGLRITDKGTKTFIVLIGSGRRRKIGRYPAITLQEARGEAQRILPGATTLSTLTIRFSDALSRYDETHCKQNLRPNTARETMRHLNRHFGYLGQKRLEDIQPHDIMRVIDSLLSTPAAANATFRAIRGFFNWAVRGRYLDRSPCERMTLPAKPKTRNRVLTEDELKAVWNAAGYYPFGTLVRLLILTGQRRGEISAMTWSQVGSRTLNFAPEQTKNHRPHEIPIGTLTRRILDELPRFQSAYVLPARAKLDRPYSGWSKGKRAFDKYCPVQDWTLHDLRRTFATSHAAIGTPVHITERLLNHSSGALTPIAAVYSRHIYMDEIREAVEQYEQHLIALIANSF